MCSIAIAPKRKEVERMLELQKHRAPDGCGVFADKKVAIGMGRLKIIDLNDYPLPYQEDGLTLSYNGEIYNYIELREELKEKGHLFTTNSDIEVLLKAYKEWGTACLDRFNGMFAFVIYDGKDFFMARDIAGEKPLYYTLNPFRVASETKALGKCEELPPAHYAIYSNGKLLVHKWWNFEPNESIRDPIIATAQLEQLLDDSIRLRTRADVPYGLYYSGGIDSSLIVTFHQFNNIINYQERLDQKEDFLKNSQKIYYHLDYPVKSFSPYGLWKLAEMASKKVKVVLSGEGADELFGGYVRYLLPHYNYEAQRFYPSYKDMFQPAKNINEYGWEEFNGNLQELLRMNDRMTSAFGIENRCPFLDRRIIEFAFSLHPSLKTNGLATKLILAGLLRIRNPDYQFKEKKGLFCPVNEWIESKGGKYEKEDYLRWQKQFFRKSQ